MRFPVYNEAMTIKADINIVCKYCDQEKREQFTGNYKRKNSSSPKFKASDTKHDVERDIYMEGIQEHQLLDSSAQSNLSDLELGWYQN